jgi:hypothetical protein
VETACQPSVKQDPIDDWIVRADQVPIALSATVSTKVTKHYAGGVSLLVYLNIGEFGIRQTQIETATEAAIAPALASFQRVWMLWKDRFYGPRAASTR